MIRPWLMLAPGLSVVLTLFGGGLVLAFLQSAGCLPAVGEPSFTLEHYRALWTDREFVAALRLSFSVAAGCTLISAVAGFLLALALRDLASRRRVFGGLLQVPLAVPHLAMAVLLIHLAAPSGLVSRLLHAAGLVPEPAGFPELIHDAHGAGIVLAYVLKETPFIALMTLALLLRTGREHEEAARALGASRWQRMRFVTLPLAAPALVSASLVVFAFVFGAFEVPYLLGRPYPAMLAVVAQRRFLGAELADRPAGIAVALVTALVTAVLVVAYLRLARLLAGIERPAVL
jgi:putative spermidine/putrescine transport system permease protein